MFNFKKDQLYGKKIAKEDSNARQVDKYCMKGIDLHIHPISVASKYRYGTNQPRPSHQAQVDASRNSNPTGQPAPKTDCSWCPRLGRVNHGRVNCRHCRASVFFQALADWHLCNRGEVHPLPLRIVGLGASLAMCSTQLLTYGVTCVADCRFQLEREKPTDSECVIQGGCDVLCK